MYKFNKRLPVRVNPVLRNQYERVLNLDGKWLFRLDPKDEGKHLQWFNKPEVFKDKILVPGCWQGQGFGNEGRDEIRDFRIQARVFRATYHGTGWYGKHFSVLKEWKKQKIWLNFGGVHPSAEVWLNGEILGKHSGPFIPFGFDVADIISFDDDNLLVVRISEENRWLGLAYNWQGYWSGIYRSVELTTTGDCWLDRFWVHPDVDEEKLRFYIKFEGNLKPLKLTVTVSPMDEAPVSQITKNISNTKEFHFDLPIQSPKPWSPDEPNLYRVDALLFRGDNMLDATTERVGFIKLSTKGKLFLINNQPYYMRGTGDFAINPETGSPDTNRDRWKKKLSALREYGYNYVRCQSYVPTPEYYDIADEVGLLVQGEMGMLGAWGGKGIWHISAWPQPLPVYRKFLKWQWNHTVMRDVNRPSSNIYCMSNELGKETLFPYTAWQCYHETKKIKPSAFVIWTDGGYNSKLPSDFINVDIVNSDVEKVDTAGYIFKKSSKPIIQHEFRWWSSYPDVKIKSKYRGAIRPYVIEIAEKSAIRNGMVKLLPLIAKNSQRLQCIEAKTKLEICRRDNPRLAGICHFNAMDSGLAPEGILDEFYETKYVDANTWRQTNGDTVVLIHRNFNDRILIGGEIFQCKFFISDFSHPPLKYPKLKWWLSDRGKCLTSGDLTFPHRAFCTRLIGNIRVTLSKISKPLAIKFHVVVSEGERTFSNQLNFWIFPQQVKFPKSVGIYGKTKNTWLEKVKDIPHLKLVNHLSKDIPQVIITQTFDENMVKYVSNGGKVLLVATEGLTRPFYPKLGLAKGRYFFTPSANYPPYDDGYNGSIIRNHYMLGDFPHEGFCDLQFYRMIAESPALDLEPLGPLKIEPTIRVFSSCFTCHQLAYLVEFGIGKGGIIICSLDLDPNFPEARYLTSTILQYAVSDIFHPKDYLSKKTVYHLITGKE